MLNRVSLNTIGLNRIGLNRIGKPSRGSSDRPYIDPEVLASLKAVCICYGKSNDDPDRAVVKNLVDPDNPFVISNAAYDKMSSYGGYEFAKFTTWNINASSTQIINISDYSITFKKLIIDEFKQPYCEILGVLNKELVLKCKSNKRLFLGWQLKYKTEEGGPDITLQIPLDSSDVIANNEMEFILPYKTKEELATLGAIESSVYYLVYFSNRYLAVGEEYTVEMLPLFEGAFVTDGIDDLITSTKTVQEMLGGSNEITVVSLITHISGTGKYNIIGDGGIQVSDYSGQTFMAGTSSSGEKIVELGDKEKLQAVQYTTFDSKLTIGLEDSSYAYYGTFVFNKENVPVDWIHQVIAYFNLDRTLNPDILCNTIKQGITNENHAEFGDKLIDFSGNGRDIQLNNIAWDGDSGIGKYNYPNWKVNVTQGNKYARIVYYDSINGTYSADFKGITDLYKSYGLSVEIRVNRANTIDYHSIKEDGIYTVTPPDDTTSIDIRFGGENVYNASCDITITQIPSNAGALCLDGVNDFGKVTGMPVYKDYTFIADRYINNNVGSVASKSVDSNQYGAFIFEIGRGNYSFNVNSTVATNLNKDRTISYLSKYSYNGENVNVGNEEDSNSLWIGTIRDNDTRFSNMAIYSLMSFPYSMSEFLIERQLKKHKLGTLYPDMVEFRPIVKSNLPYSSISYSVNPGEYISVDSMVTITVTLPNTSDKLMEVSCNAISDISISGDNGVYEITGKIVKSPQKINLVISSYLTMLNNETLISNETLIKNE